jgi:hypothetical protein
VALPRALPRRSLYQRLPTERATTSPLLKPFLPILTAAELHFWQPFFRHHQALASCHLTASPSQPSKKSAALEPLATPPQHRITGLRPPHRNLAGAPPPRPHLGESSPRTAFSPWLQILSILTSCFLSQTCRELLGLSLTTTRASSLSRTDAQLVAPTTPSTH